MEMTGEDVAVFTGLHLWEMVANKWPRHEGRVDGLDIKTNGGRASVGIVVSEHQDDF
jgi:hypothetical protein